MQTCLSSSFDTETHTQHSLSPGCPPFALFCTFFLQLMKSQSLLRQVIYIFPYLFIFLFFSLRLLNLTRHHAAMSPSSNHGNNIFPECTCFKPFQPFLPSLKCLAFPIPFPIGFFFLALVSRVRHAMVGIGFGVDLSWKSKSI